MDASPPERSAQCAVLVRGAVVGALMGLLALAAAEEVLAGAPRVLASVVGLAVTMVIALGAGTWAGAPAALEDDPPTRGRWLGLGLSVAVAGALFTAFGYNRAAAALPVGRILELLLGVGLPYYAGGLTLPALLAWGERREPDAEPESELEGEAATWGALGALVMGVFGGLGAGLLLGGLLLARFPAGPVLLAASFLPLLTLGPDEDTPEAEERTVFETESPFGSLRVTEVVYPGERQPERRLYVNGEEESGELARSGAPALPYVAAAERWLSEAAAGAGSYLFLGGGAYTLPRRIAERDPAARVEVVEIDPEVTRVAYRFFGLRPEHGIRTVHGDARAYLRSARPASVDRIYVDVYGGSEALPHSLVTREAFEEMRAVLRPGGWAALNLIGRAAGPESLRFGSVVRTFASVFPTIALYSHLGPEFPERQNFLLAGSTDAEVRFPERAGYFESVPASRWAGRAGTTVFRDLLPARAERPAAMESGAEPGSAPRGEPSAPSPSRPPGR